MVLINDTDILVCIIITIISIVIYLLKKHEIFVLIALLICIGQILWYRSDDSAQNPYIWFYIFTLSRIARPNSWWYNKFYNKKKREKSVNKFKDSLF